MVSKHTTLLVLFLLAGCDDQQPAKTPEQRGLVYSRELGAWMIPGAAKEPLPVDWAEAALDAGELRCLASNIYFEARGASLADQVAVAHVTLNRVDSGRYPGTICGVVFQPHQFSWTGDRQLTRHKVDRKSYKRAIAIAKAVFYGEKKDPTNGAMYYYAPKKITAPKWARAGYDVVTLEGHTYMKLASQ